jgi:hypothetical protein
VAEVERRKKMTNTLVSVLFKLLTQLILGLYVQVYDKYIRTKALSIVYSCTSVLGAMSGVYKVFS